jgi:hypothetical protein
LLKKRGVLWVEDVGDVVLVNGATRDAFYIGLPGVWRQFNGFAGEVCPNKIGILGGVDDWVLKNKNSMAVFG